MRIYILSLSKYLITFCVMAFTIFAYLLLFIRDRNRRRNVCRVEKIFLLIYQILCYGTIFTGYMQARYLVFGLLHIVIFLFAEHIFETLYDKGHRALFYDMCMMMSMGLVIITRLDFSRAVKQLIFATLGMFLALFLPLLRGYFRMLKKPGFLYAAAGIAVLAAVLLFSQATNGSNITATVHGITFQPSEFVKILFILFLASTLNKYNDRQQILVIAAFALAHVLILVASRDLGSALIYFMIFLFMMYLARGKWQILAGGFGLCAIGSLLCYRIFRHVQVRVQAWLDPWSVIETDGYQISQSLFAISNGGLFGAGLTQGSPDDIPFVESDFIYAAIAEEQGLLVCVCLILLCLNILIIILMLASRFDDKFYQLSSFGAAICYGVQTFLTVGGETKFIPLTGVTLPLVSYGGSSILATLLMLTGIQTMYILRAERIAAFRQRKRRRQYRQRQQEEEYALEDGRSGEYTVGDRNSGYILEDHRYH